MNKFLFYGHYTQSDVIDQIEELNEILCDLEIFEETDVLFHVEIYPNVYLLNILFNGEYVLSTEDPCDWEYDYENDKWTISLQEYLKQWLLKRKETYSKIEF